MVGVFKAQPFKYFHSYQNSFFFSFFLDKYAHFIHCFVSNLVFPECNSAMFVSHTWPTGLLPPEALQTGEVHQRRC